MKVLFTDESAGGIRHLLSNKSNVLTNMRHLLPDNSIVRTNQRPLLPDKCLSHYKSILLTHNSYLPSDNSIVLTNEESSDICIIQNVQEVLTNFHGMLLLTI